MRHNYIINNMDVDRTSQSYQQNMSQLRRLISVVVQQIKIDPLNRPVCPVIF